MTPFTAYEHDSWLHRRNPTAKLSAHLIMSLALTLIFDPITPLICLVVAVALGVILARLPIRLLLGSLTPFCLLGTSLVVSNALFAAGSSSTGTIWSWGPLRATMHGTLIGLSLAERGLTIAALSLLILLSTDPAIMVRSLVQQARLPARIAYPILAAYRFLPFLRDELDTIRLARRLRGQGRRRGPLGSVVEAGSTLVPLLAGAIRRAERVAIAMDARGFDAHRTRTYFRRVVWQRADTGLVLGAIVVSAGILWTSAHLGMLHAW